MARITDSFFFQKNQSLKEFFFRVMARTSSIYDLFDLYLTPVTLTSNLPEKMFQMALLLLEGNNCAKLF